ncbi:MAG TPA: SLC13 family permease [Gaiellaceae bacterium]
MAAVHAAGQVWPAFVLVTGLILVGTVAERDGLFAAAGSLLGRLPGGGRSVYCVALALVALVTAVLNLDTAVVFLTPVLVHLARTRGTDEAPFLYGAVMMANAGSLFLPGSNLTNLIVLNGEHVAGATFLERMWPAAVTAPLATAVVLVVVFRRELAPTAAQGEDPPFRLGLGAAAVAVATVVVLVLQSPALPVLAVGVASVVAARVPWRSVAEVADPRVLVGLFALAVALGALGRLWTWPAHQLATLGRAGTTAVAGAASLAVNNLPASVLLAPHPPRHARALLIGLNLAPNLAVTGSLSAFLWLRVARAAGARPSAVRYSRIGVVAAPVAAAAALAALWLLSPGRV